MEHKIPDGDWTVHLANAIRRAEPGDTIVVQTAVRKQLALSAANRLGKTGIEFLVSGELSEA
jgi:hypothetical protein